MHYVKGWERGKGAVLRFARLVCTGRHRAGNPDMSCTELVGVATPRSAEKRGNVFVG